METEFRFNFLLWAAVNVLWGALRVTAVFLLFTNIGNIVGWSREQALILAVVHSFVLSLLWTSILPNLYIFPELVRKGDLDFALLKPVSTRFLVSARYFEFDQLARLILSPILLYVMMAQFNFLLNASQILTFIIVLGLGILIIYNVYFIIMTFSIWLVSVENLQHFMMSLNDVGMYPTNIFQGAFRGIFFYVIPIVFIATYPAAILVGKAGGETIWICVAFAILSSIISHKFWHFALKRYSSASS